VVPPDRWEDEMMAFKATRTVVTLEPRDVLRLQEILMDEDAKEAFAFVQDVIGEKIRCAQVESHKTQFEGGTGDEVAHHLQKGEGHPTSEQSEGG
jgi:hypothetical protein